MNHACKISSRFLSLVLVNLLLLATILMPIDMARATEDLTLTPPSTVYENLVYIDIWDVRVFEIDTNAEFFSAEATLQAQWNDPRQIFDETTFGTDIIVFHGPAAEEVLKNRVWWPNFDIDDSRGSRNIINQSLAIKSNGDIFYTERFSVEIMQDYNLHNFPFDEHQISFKIQPFTSSLSNLISFTKYPSALPFQLEWEPSEWVVSSGAMNVTSSGCPESDDSENEECNLRDYNDTAAMVEFTITRVPEHYLTNYVLPIMLIVLISTAVFFMGFESMHLGDRLSVSFTSVLTIVAFDFVASENLPKLWYSTGIDNVLTAAYIFLALNVLENVIASRLFLKHPATSKRIDTVFRWLYPILFILTTFYIVGSLMPDVD